MNWISGIIMLCGVAGMAFWFRPRERDSLLLCGIGLFMGVLSLLMSDGLLPLQAVEQGMQAVILGLCFVQLRREKKARSVQQCVEGAYSHAWTITALQVHPRGILVCDEGAAEELKVSTYRYFKDIEKDNII